MDEQKPINDFELCRDLHVKGFPQRRSDQALYYIRPDLLVHMIDNDVFYGEDGKSQYNFFETAIYRPELQDFIDFLGSDLQQVTQTVRSGWFAYTNSTKGEGITTRSGGISAWQALANVVLARYLERDIAFPIMDMLESENSHEDDENG